MIQNGKGRVGGKSRGQFLSETMHKWFLNNEIWTPSSHFPHNTGKVNISLGPLTKTVECLWPWIEIGQSNLL